jgi:thiamine pyrophosphokinase
MKRYVIMAAGDFPSHPEPLAVLNKADVLIACDSAAASLVKQGMKIDYVVGDMDSLEPEYRESLKDKLIHIREQDTNDLQKAFRFTCSMLNEGDKITILGAAGKREDHTIANISLLTDFALVHPEIKIYTETGVFFPVLKSGTFPSFPGQAISLFNPGSGKIFLNSENLEYPLNHLELSRWWTASLNRAQKESFSLTLEGNGGIIVFAVYQEEAK